MAHRWIYPQKIATDYIKYLDQDKLFYPLKEDEPGWIEKEGAQVRQTPHPRGKAILRSFPKVGVANADMAVSLL